VPIGIYFWIITGLAQNREFLAMENPVSNEGQIKK
jgi:hypothetical protein